MTGPQIDLHMEAGNHNPTGLDPLMTFREVAHGHGSPGQIYKLPEDDVRARVERLAQQTKNYFSYAESANLQKVQRRDRRKSIDLLDDVFRQEGKA